MLRFVLFFGSAPGARRVVHDPQVSFFIMHQALRFFFLALTFFQTKSPCSMCSGAVLLYGIPRVVIGENSTFVGEEDLLRSRGVQVVVLNDARCEKMMRDFIKEHPEVST